MKRLEASASVVLALTLTSSALAQGEWTRFRGPDGTGIGKAQGLPVTFTADDYAWQVRLPARGHSSPVVWGDRIFVTCSRDKEGVRYVVCLDAANGKTRWTWEDKFAVYRHHGLNSFAASTPAADAQRVYVSWVSGQTAVALALDHEGEPLWRRELGHFSGRHGAGASPIVLGDLVVVGKDHRGRDGFLVGLDSATGETRWKCGRGSKGVSYITPTVYRPEGMPPELIFASVAHGITSVDPTSGKVNWEVGGLFKQKSVASPVVAGDVVFVSAGRGGRGTESAAVRSSDGKAEVLYRLKEELPYVPTPIVVDGHLFIWSDHGVVTCVKPESGEVVWRKRLGGKFFSSPVCVEGRLYCPSRKGKMVVIEAASTYKLLGRSQLPEGTHATPAIANNAMYIRTFDHLLCVKGEGTKPDAQ